MRPQLLVLVLALAATAAHADTWNKTYNVSGTPSLYVKAGDGSLRVTSSDAKTIAITVTTEGYRLAPDAVTIDESQSGDSVRLELHVPHGHLLTFGWDHRRIQIDITVPRTAALDLNTSDGHIEAFRVAGDLRFHTGDGSIDLHDLDGALLASSGDGHINADGRFDALDIHTGDGHVEVDARRGSRVSRDWRLKSGDGSVRLRLPDDFGADLDAASGDGSIKVDFPVTVEGGRIRRSRIHGKLNGGGGLLEIRTGDGSIHIDRL
jgi:hypothetical protein